MYYMGTWSLRAHEPSIRTPQAFTHAFGCWLVGLRRRSLERSNKTQQSSRLSKGGVGVRMSEGSSNVAA